MEVAAANILAGGSVFVKAIGPVDTHQTDKVEEQADTHTGRLAKGEGVHLAHVRPSISGFDKAEGIDVGGSFKHEGIAEFETETRVGIGVSSVVAGDGAVFITAQGDGLLSVGGVAGHTVTTDVEGFEGRFAVFVVGANDTEVGARHDDRTMLQTRIEGGVGAETEYPFVVFQPAIFLLCLLVVGRTVVVRGQSLIVFPIKEGVGWSEGELEIEVRTAAGEEGVVGRIAGERKADVEVVTVAVGDEEIVAVPVLHVVARVADIDHKLEIVVGPVKALSEADIQTDDVHVFVGVVVIGRVVVAAVGAVAGVILRIIVAIIVVIVGTIVGLVRIERGEGEVVGPLSAKPGIGKGQREVGVVATVRLCRQ